ncbi:hypothetical protein BT96DRAFT_1004620 [Gymnopus androsaceus JB14]|uniref:Uncharacterized protein n=1 Tax=Gymnopus androsaceus JB14 TaxID=1447944 RepID=A0A6A4GRG9_9AGAR|nr:hypothetical protein BT96DRAFT_1004620 [Gymnopus androsaceus JB14]
MGEVRRAEELKKDKHLQQGRRRNSVSSSYKHRRTRLPLLSNFVLTSDVISDESMMETEAEAQEELQSEAQITSYQQNTLQSNCTVVATSAAVSSPVTFVAGTGNFSEEMEGGEIYHVLLLFVRYWFVIGVHRPSSLTCPPVTSTLAAVPPSTPTRRRLSAYSSPSHSNPSTPSRWLDTPTDEAYSMSPGRAQSRQLLKSLRRQLRSICKTLYLDWLSTNVLGVGLGSCVYLWTAHNAAVSKLCDLADTKDTISSVSWVQVQIQRGLREKFLKMWNSSLQKEEEFKAEEDGNDRVAREELGLDRRDDDDDEDFEGDETGNDGGDVEAPDRDEEKGEQEAEEAEYFGFA